LAKWFLSIDGIEKNFIASDEAYFHLSGTLNNHNYRIWSDSDPNYVIEQPLKPSKVLLITLSKVFENMTQRCKTILEKEGKHI
jgi:hypothetical protein